MSTPPLKKSALKARKKPTQERSRETVQAILQATARILVTEGYDGASTNRVAEAAGVSVGSLYQYFPNKASLVAALLDQHARQLLALFETTAMDLADAPLAEATKLLVRAVLEAHRVNPKLHRVLFEQIPHSAIAERKAEMLQRTQLLLLAYMRHHAAELEPQNLEVAAFVAAQALEGIARGTVLLRPELLQTDALVDEASAMLIRYFQKRKRPPTP